MKNNKLKQSNKPKDKDETDLLKVKKKTQLSSDKIKVKPIKLLEDIDEDDLLAYEKMLRE